MSEPDDVTQRDLTPEQPQAAVRQDPGAFPAVAGDGLAAGWVVSEAARRLQSALDDLAEGQARLTAELARSRRRSALLIVLVLILVGVAGSVWYDHAQATPIVLPGQARELDREDLAAEIQDLSAQVRSARLERNQHLGESLRLREQLLESERRLAELTSGLGELASRVVTRPQPEVTVSSTADRDLAENPAHAVGQALLASGVAELTIVEHGPLEHGVLYDVLLTRQDPWGAPSRAERFDRAHLQVRDGLVALVLERAATVEGQAAQIERVPMPAADLEAWAAAGLELDKGVITVARAEAALAAVLEGQAIQLESLGGYGEGRFFELVLVERDRRDVVRRSWSAASAELLPVGPALLLEQGFLTEERGEPRPFWNGRVRLVLEGARYGAFQEALRASANKRGKARRG